MFQEEEDGTHEYKVTAFLCNAGGQCSDHHTVKLKEAQLPINCDLEAVAEKDYASSLLWFYSGWKDIDKYSIQANEYSFGIREGNVGAAASLGGKIRLIQVGLTNLGDQPPHYVPTSAGFNASEIPGHSFRIRQGSDYSFYSRFKAEYRLMRFCGKKTRTFKSRLRLQW
ncbi:hypothetical protein Ciccas_002346 [Cichlidogyrus casuarinus]|uniref:Uncharacterized protein n=1 Tax=Cichlidogyrus casuarinus TaxID=1844966 RepID=A0ABD2QHG9_9PLAT